MDKPGNRNYSILLVEDDESLAAGLEYNLIEEGYKVYRVDNGRDALAFLSGMDVDLLILDIMLPFADGFEVTEKIRSYSPSLPILMLTAKASPQDKVKGLSLGADDYLVKPFHLDELLLRIKGIIKRKNWYRKSLLNQSEYCFSGNCINFRLLTCRTSKGSFKLTPLEGALLRYFVDNKGRVITREELLHKVWHIQEDIETRTVDNFIGRLRKYFESSPPEPRFFRNVRGTGYIFDPGIND